ncbi:MAG: DUF3098 domain-containing protein [Saprospiraceae bacterium]|nr:DUF3098 domain-containing protein [Saprospiraceae bacterium]
MSKQNQPKKPAPAVAERKSTTTSSNTASREKAARVKIPLLFGKSEFKWILIGVGLEFLGMILMLGGAMPNADTWDPSLIYSPLRITVAPLLMVAGLVVVALGIFHKPKVEEIAEVIE